MQQKLFDEFKKNLYANYGEIVFKMQKCQRKDKKIRKGKMKEYKNLLERKKIYENKLHEIS